jgi:hypothetical protein
MSFNPFDHALELVRTNVFVGELFGLPRPDTMPIGDSFSASTAVPGQPDTIEYYLWNGDGFTELTADQAYVQMLYLHAAYGMPLDGDQFQVAGLQALDLDQNFVIDYDGMYDAVASMPHIVEAITVGGYSPDQVWAYAQAETPWAFA